MICYLDLLIPVQQFESKTNFSIGLNYNKFSKDDDFLEADKVILLTLLDRNEWYVFAAMESCLVFWINLEPDRFIELIDGGSLGKDQGLWRKD